MLFFNAARARARRARLRACSAAAAAAAAAPVLALLLLSLPLLLTLGTVYQQHRRPPLTMVVPATVDVSFMSPGVAPLAVTTSESGGNTFVTVDVAEICGDLGDIANAHAVIASDGTIYVGGCCGLQPAADGGPSIAPGGPGPETSRCMQLLEVFLRACGAGVEHITMVHVYLIDNTTARFGEMNAA